MSIVKACSCLTALFFLSFATFSRGYAPDPSGKEIFEKHCVKCHGNDGARGRWGAKNLQVSRLSDSELILTIARGKNIMPSWNRTLNEREIRLVKEYIKTLRK